MKKNPRSAHTLLLALLALAVALVATAACSGGGSGQHSAAPCCGATGQVQPATAPFAPLAAPATLFAAPFLFENNATACPSLGSVASLDALFHLQPAGSEALVDAATNLYTVKLTTAAEGKKVAVLVYTKAGGKHVTGVGLVDVPALASTSTIVQVNPVRLVTTTSFGESTLEVAVECELVARNKTGKLTDADIRGIVTPELARGYVVTPANADTLVSRLVQFDAALTGFGAFGTSAQQTAFVTLRNSAEERFDSCRNAVEVPDCNPIDEAHAEQSRYMAMVTSAFGLGLDPYGTSIISANRPYRYHLHSWAQMIEEQIGQVPAPPAVDLVAQSIVRQEYMLRYAVAYNAIIDALNGPLGNLGNTVSFSYTTGGQPSISDALTGMGEAVASQATLGGVQQQWDFYASAIMLDVDRQVFDPASPATPMLDEYKYAAKNYANLVPSALSNVSTYNQVFSQVFGNPPGPSAAQADWQSVNFDIIQGQFTASFSSKDQDRLTDIVFFGSASSTPFAVAPAP
jgi:hypothetical protein